MDGKTRPLRHPPGVVLQGFDHPGVAECVRLDVRQVEELRDALVGAADELGVDVGIDDRFIEQVRAEVSPGTSALFVMSSDAVMDKVRESFSDLRPELIFTNLSDDQEAAIREVFAE